MRKYSFVQRLFNALVWLVILALPFPIGFIGGKYSVFDPKINGVSASDVLVIRADEFQNDAERDPQYASFPILGGVSTLSYLYSGLVKIDEDGQVVPDLAERWNVSPDYLTYTFTLRANAKFGDGKKVTAKDVAYTLKRAASSDASSDARRAVRDIVGYDEFQIDGENFAGVRESGSQTIEITLARPIHGFLYNLTLPSLYIVDMDNMDDPNWRRQPNGTGPYQMIENVAGQYAFMQRKEDYYGELPSIRYIQFMYQNNSYITQEDVDDYANDMYDVIKLNYLEADEFQAETSPFRNELLTFKPWCFSFFALKNNGIFNDILIRRAFNAAIERDVYVQLMYGGDAVVSHSVFSQGMPGYSESNNYAVYDLDVARLALQRAQVTQQSIQLVEYGFIDESSKEYEIIGQMIRRANSKWINNGNGLEMIVVKVDSNMSTSIRSDMVGTRSCMLNPDPAYALDKLLLAYELSGRDASEFKTLYQDAEVEPNAAKRIEMFQELERQIMDEVPIAFTATPNDYYLVKSYVRGFNAIPGVALPLQEMNIDSKKFYLFTAMLREQVANFMNVIMEVIN